MAQSANPNDLCPPGAAATTTEIVYKEGDVKNFSAVPQVKAIQEWLIAKGHAGAGGADGKPDGVFGRGSRGAFQQEIEALQKKNGLEVTGNVDQSTLAALTRENPAAGAAVATLQGRDIDGVSAYHRMYQPGQAITHTSPGTAENCHVAPGTTADVVPDIIGSTHPQAGMIMSGPDQSILNRPGNPQTGTFTSGPDQSILNRPGNPQTGTFTSGPNQSILNRPGNPQTGTFTSGPNQSILNRPGQLREDVPLLIPRPKATVDMGPGKPSEPMDVQRAAHPPADPMAPTTPQMRVRGTTTSDAPGNYAPAPPPKSYFTTGPVTAAPRPDHTQSSMSTAPPVMGSVHDKPSAREDTQGHCENPLTISDNMPVLNNGPTISDGMPVIKIDGPLGAGEGDVVRQSEPLTMCQSLFDQFKTAGQVSTGVKLSQDFDAAIASSAPYVRRDVATSLPTAVNLKNSQQKL